MKITGFKIQFQEILKENLEWANPILNIYFIQLSWDGSQSKNILNYQKLFIVKYGKVSLVFEFACFKIPYIVYNLIACTKYCSPKIE